MTNEERSEFLELGVYEYVRIYFFNQINVINVDILIRRIFFEWVEVNMDILFLQACFLLQREIPAPFKEGLSHRYQVKNHLFCRWIRERSAPEGTFQPNRKGWIVFQAPPIFFRGKLTVKLRGGVFQLQPKKNKNESNDSIPPCQDLAFCLQPSSVVLSWHHLRCQKNCLDPCWWSLRWHPWMKLVPMWIIAKFPWPSTSFPTVPEELKRWFPKHAVEVP